MPARLSNPFPQFLDDVPNVGEGYRLFFYEAGTSTKLHTYKEQELSNANTNPIVLNEYGRTDFSVFLQDVAYKVVLAGPDAAGTDDPPSNVIWTADYVRGTDFRVVPKWQVGSGNPNGVIAGTAGSSGVMPDVYWDYTNSILYICTTTGTAVTAVWTALNQASAAALPPPQGRLTLTTGTPVMPSSVSAAAAIYYTPHVGNLVPIYNGATFVSQTFSELTLSLHSSHATSTLYDIFVFNNSGVLTLVTGPAWATSTAGSGDRGTGSTTAELTRVNGYDLNAVAITGRNGATTYSVGANLATYLGTMLVDSGSAGQVSYLIDYGQSRRIGLYNEFNQVPVTAKCGDATTSWTYASTTVRPSNNSTSNAITFILGAARQRVLAEFVQYSESQNAGTADQSRTIGIGFNSTTAASGKVGKSRIIYGAGGGTNGVDLVARHAASPAIGAHVITALEAATTNATNTFLGGEDDMLMTLRLMA